MTTRVYYNDNDPYCAQWLKNLIAAGHLPPGDVDDRDIRAVEPMDLAGYAQCHFFAGIGGFPLGLRLAGFPDARAIWTGGFPCQPFSVAGRRAGIADNRHLWPQLARLVASARPALCLFENVPGLVAVALDGVLADLESAGYACRALVVPACAVDAPHRRDRLWIAAALGQPVGAGRDARPAAAAAMGYGRTAVAAGPALADAQRRGRDRIHEREQPGHLATDACGSREPRADGAAADDYSCRISGQGAQSGDALADADIARANDHTARGRPRRAAGEPGRWPAEPGVCRVAHGIPARVAKLRALGNAVVPQVVAEIARGFLT